MEIKYGFKQSDVPSQLKNLVAGFSKQFPEVNGRAVRRATEDLRTQLIEAIRGKQSRYATGHLMRSINRTVTEVAGHTVKASVGTPLEYAPYLEYGTKGPSRLIVPVRKKALSWRIRSGTAAPTRNKWGDRIFAMSSRGGPIKAWNVFRDTARWIEQRIRGIYVEEFRKVK